jgi:hypothetical protein
MSRPRPSRTGMKEAVRGRDGFALLLAVMLLAFAVLLLVALATLTRVETSVAYHTDQAARARSDALMALNLALGQLQRYAGPDGRVSASADAFGATDGTRHYTGVWDSDSGGVEPLTWLVSGNESEPLTVRPTTATADLFELLGAGTASSPRRVVVPLQTVDVVDPPGQLGPVPVTRYAWWVEDLGVKASLALPDRSAEVVYGPWGEPVERKRLRQRIGSVPTWMETSAGGATGFDPWHIANRSALGRAIAQDQLAWLEPAGAVALPASLREHYHDLTTAAHGVPANTLPPSDPARGLMRDLSLAPDFLGPAFVAYSALGYIEPPSAGNDALPPITTVASPRRRVRVQAPVTQAGAADVPPLVLTTAPVLSEFLLQFRVDRVAGGVELRSRLYVGLWNPYTSALVPPGDLNVVVSGLPKIAVHDPHAATEVEIDLQAAPFGPWADQVYLPFTAGSTPQTDRQSWLPGRMYSWSTRTGPGPSRDLQFYEKTLDASGWVIGVTSLGGENDHLQVSAPPVTNLVVQLRSGSDVLATSRAPPFQPFGIPDVEPAAEGTNYYNWRFSYAFRLNQPSKNSTDRSWLVTNRRDPRAIELLPDSFDPFNALGGFDPAAAPVYVGIPPTSNGLNHHLIFRTQGPGLASRSANYDAPVFELPRQPLLSLGELQHLHVVDQRPFSIGNPWGGELNALFDRFFFTGLAPAGPGPDLAGREPLPNWNLIPVDSRGASVDLVVLRDAGAYASRFLLQRGAFNVNSTSAAAWRAVLSSVRFPADLAFERADIDNASVPTSVTGSQRAEDAVIAESFNDPAWGSAGASGPAFFRFPQTAQETYYWSNSPALTTSQLSRQAFRQGVRGGTANALHGLSAAQVAVFASRISALVRAKHAASGPFRSMEEFVNARPELGGRSVLERAIAEAELNAVPLRPLAEVADPAHLGFSSLTLTPADVLTAIAPYLRNRSDTFAIRAYAESLNPPTGAVAARAWCEAIVQRMPMPVDAGDSIDQPAGPFGRRFQIVAFRWLSPTEI